MPLKVHIDDPANLRIDRPSCKIQGWCAADSAETVQYLQFRIAGSAVPYIRMERPDVGQVLPDKSVGGFLIDLDLSFYIQGVWKGEFLLQVITANEPVVELRFRISQEALGKCLEAAAGT